MVRGGGKEADSLLGVRLLFVGNLVFVAAVEKELCSRVEDELIWQGRRCLTYNNQGKITPPRQPIYLVHSESSPTWDNFELTANNPSSVIDVWVTPSRVFRRLAMSSSLAEFYSCLKNEGKILADKQHRMIKSAAAFEPGTIGVKEPIKELLTQGYCEGGGKYLGPSHDEPGLYRWIAANGLEGKLDISMGFRPKFDDAPHVPETLFYMSHSSQNIDYIDRMLNQMSVNDLLQLLGKKRDL